MPTGYTAGVSDGSVSDFRTFALQCARAFGATIMQRDDPADEPPKHRVVDDYYPNAVKDAQVRIASLEVMSLHEAERECAADYAKRIADEAKYEANRKETRDRYLSMIDEVARWNPPTSEHRGLKDFMLKQLKESIDFDCTAYPTKIVRYTAGMWLQREKDYANESLIRAEERLAQQTDLTRKANEWIDALYESLLQSSNVMESQK